MMRGLIYHWREHIDAGGGGARQLILWANNWADAQRKPDGCCRWCRLPIGGEKRANARWHDDCHTAYLIAAGNHYGIIPLDKCMGCPKAAAVTDHRLAICVAAELGAAALIRAYTLDNLQPLCQDCHNRKTRVDLLIARALNGRRLGYKDALALFHARVNLEMRRRIIENLGFDLDGRYADAV